MSFSRFIMASPDSKRARIEDDESSPGTLIEADLYANKLRTTIRHLEAERHAQRRCQQAVNCHVDEVLKDYLVWDGAADPEPLVACLEYVQRWLERQGAKLEQAVELSPN